MPLAEELLGSAAVAGLADCLDRAAGRATGRPYASAGRGSTDWPCVNAAICCGMS
ncbi:hypothetical protein ACFQ51_04040 [Streptomyces kaempferi]